MCPKAACGNCRRIVTQSLPKVHASIDHLEPDHDVSTLRGVLVEPGVGRRLVLRMFDGGSLGPDSTASCVTASRSAIGGTTALPPNPIGSSPGSAGEATAV